MNGDTYILNLSGFMLAVDGGWRPGGQWWPHSTMVYVCRNLATAKRILQMSQDGLLLDCPVWATIYRVSAPKVKCVRSDKDVIWTTDASKIIVDSSVFHQAPRMKSEEELLANAKKQRPEFERLMRIFEENER